MSFAERPSDDSLDRRLRDVPLPDGLCERLAADVPADEALDRRLAEVMIPFGLKYRLREIASPPRWRSRRMLAVAASFLLVAAWQIASLWSYVRMFPSVPSDRPRSIIASIPPAPPGRGEPSIEFVPTLPAPRLRAEDRLRFDAAEVMTQQRATLAAAYAPHDVRATRGPDVFQWIASATGVGTSAAGVLGKPPGDDPPDLVRVVWRMPRGVEVPLAAADRQFLLDTGSFPFVSPREFPRSSVPLIHDTTAFETSRSTLAAGQWPSADEMRAEEFLAAADYRFARPTDRAARLIVAGAIAPWNPTAPPERPLPPDRVSRLLQLGVQARELPPAARSPTHLTIAVDVTAGMRSGGRLEMVKQATAAMIRRLGGADRVTLVAVGGDNSVVIQEAGRAELDQLLAAVDWLSAGRSGSLSSGVLAACRVAAARETPKNVVRRLVVVSDAFGEFDPRGIRAVERLLATSAARGLQLHLLDVAGGSEPTPWDDVARAHDGKTYRVETAERMRSALMEVLTGRSQLVASGAVLSVTFHSPAVVGYRLIGHEPTPLAGVMPQRLEVDLHAGQAAAVLYEVRLGPGKETEIGTAVLRWLDPIDGAAQEIVQPITRAMLGAAFDKSAPSLQLAAVATATAARLRNSPWADNVAPAEVLQWARRLQQANTGRSVEPWITLLDEIRRLPPPRRGAVRGSR